MDLDDILALAETGEPSPLELARARRVARAVRSEYDRSLTDRYEILVDTDLIDPLTANSDEATRIARAAQLAKRGTITWLASHSDMSMSDPSWSDEMAMIFGHAPGTRRLTHELLLELIHPADARAFQSAVEKAWKRNRPGEVTFRVLQPNGSVRYVHCDIEILTAPSGISATGVDVTAFELARQEHRRRATREAMLCPDLAARDAVTGLPTRGFFTDEVDRARRTSGGTLIVVATEPATRLSKSTTDEDRDQLTSEVAALLHQVADSGLTCGLVGPGLWGVLAFPQEDCPAATELAHLIVEKLRSNLFSVQQEALRLYAWAGVVNFASGASAAGFDLLIDGEHAARDAARKGILVNVLDRPAEDQERANRCRSRIQHAVATDRFALYAQPLVDLGINEVTRHEILLRVRGNNGELAAPWAFLDMAERVGEILSVDKWVIEHALELIGQGVQTSHYQVNISGKSLADPGLLAFVADAIRRHRVKPECLTFEITETALIENRNEALAFATGVREIGCHLALDDFGTGYAGLAYLKYLPVDLVKIDGVFIVDICRSPTDQAVVLKLVELCHALGIRVAAEYVQDDETVRLLREYGVDFAQGYRTGRPEPIAASLQRAENTIEFEIRLPERRTAMG
jgi:EAL domain-containing protein (putative c-di-GMP-specific phosphodiesterase class I)/GGDEF domain-containing protein